MGCVLFMGVVNFYHNSVGIRMSVLVCIFVSGLRIFFFSIFSVNFGKLKDVKCDNWFLLLVEIGNRKYKIET